MSSKSKTSMNTVAEGPPGHESGSESDSEQVVNKNTPTPLCTSSGTSNAHEDEFARVEDSFSYRKSKSASSVYSGEQLPTQESETTPRIWTSSSAKANASRRLKGMKYTFSPPKISFFSLQQHILGRSPHKAQRDAQKGEGKKNSRLKKRKIGGDGSSSNSANSSARRITYMAPTYLHGICYSASSPEELKEVSMSYPQSDDSARESRPSLSIAATQRDDQGRLPLHVLSQNKKLSISVSGYRNDSDDIFTTRILNPNFTSTQDSYIAKFVLGVLLPAFPEGMMEKDKNGRIPFEQALIDWIDDVHHDHEHYLSQRRLGTQIMQEISRLDLDDGAHSNTPQNVVKQSLLRTAATVSRAGKTIQLLRPYSATSSTPVSSGVPGDIKETLSGKNACVSSLRSLESIENSSNKSIGDRANCENGTKGNSSVDPSIDAKEIEEATVENGLQGKTGRETLHIARHRQFPERAHLTPHLDSTLQLLSLILDSLEEQAEQDRRRRKLLQSRNRSFESALVRESSVPSNDSKESDVVECVKEGKIDLLLRSIIDTIASIPNLVKTLLLIDDDDERHRVFHYSAMKQVLQNKHSVGKWLTSMLQSTNKKVSQRAVDYLHIASQVLEDDKRQMYLEGSKSSSEVKDMQVRHDELHEAVSVLKGLIPSMLALDERMIEEAATTPIVSRVLDMMISRPFAVSIVFFDSLFLALLIFSFRRSVNGLLNGKDPNFVLKWIYVANANVFYFVIREIGKVISLCMLTRRAFLVNYLWSFWNIVDILSTALALASTVAMRVAYNSHDFTPDTHLRGLLAVTTGVLWLRVLGLLKSINMQLATFVLAIVQITRDILWFLSILLVAVVSFAQMFYTLLMPEECALPDERDGVVGCEHGEYYLKVYSILLGDYGEFERDDFTTVFSVILIVFFSFMVVIVLLNVLIAIVSDSYEKCLVRSQSLFGRARVWLLAELVSFRNLLRTNQNAAAQSEPNWWTRQRWRQGWTHGSMIFYCVSGCIVVLWIIGEAIGYLASPEDYGSIAFSIGSIVVNLGLLVGIIAITSKGASNDSAKVEGCGKSISQHFLNCYEHSIQKFMLRLLGTSADTSSLLAKHGEMEEWRGRVPYLQREMVRIASEHSESTKLQVKAIEQQLTLTDSRIRKEIDSLENKMIESDAVLMAELKGTEQRIESMLRHYMNQMISTISSEAEDNFRDDHGRKGDAGSSS